MSREISTARSIVAQSNGCVNTVKSTTENDDIMAGYRNLALMTVVWAMRDYKHALKQLRKKPDNYYAKIEKEKAERFLLSDDCEWYCGVPGIDLLNKLDREVYGNGYIPREAVS